MIKLKEVEDNNVYLTLDNHKSDEFILKQNLDALITHKNDEMTRIAQDMVSIPAALVRLKWENRREIYSLQVKEEIYGAMINAVMTLKPELKEKIMGRLESNYQHLLSREVSTLRLTRKLADGGYHTSNVTAVALDEEALAAKADAASPAPVDPE
ncbi:cytoplasmic protein [Lelliottia sp. V106_10]|uniref:cytoplasmic protein n=1 Tax=Lelliottia wanjuensis TaxID=3050585 RepID=UPI00254DA3C6|nr:MULTISPECIES: cytoplasmic protein [unclassified Lelliottia]MDK9354939.1 cytoplasmic protein [Lelliottia sp. V106_16]MDK9372147.1 cytoplasmic protein [Lelliottia sp. V106_10]MDK9598783.1 cytoplasmic protein [Lelliottia sp. V106_5]